VILKLPDTTTSLINSELLRIRLEAGVITLGRVMTLVIDATGADLEVAIETANVASREHPCRIIVFAPRKSTKARLDAEIRVGGDAGAAEVVVLRPSGEMAEHGDTLVIPLLLPDAPIVAWWPGPVPAGPANTPIGAMATRRITDSRDAADVPATLRALAAGHVPGDTDLAWARVTRWRALLAAALDQIPEPTVTRALIYGNTGNPSVVLLGAWLQCKLGCEYEAMFEDDATGLRSVVLETPTGEVSITRLVGLDARLVQPGQPDHVIALPHRTLSDCLAEDLRRLDADDVYGETLSCAARGFAP
jgi:glucose-6-phosphate dehydrogenase assembly protein OpcA